MKVLALVTDAFGGSGGIAQYNRDLVAALAQCSGSGGIIILSRRGNNTAVPTGPYVRQLKIHKNQIVYAFVALSTAVRRGPFDFVYCGHLHLAPLAAFLAWLLGIPLWLQLHGWEAWENPRRTERWAAERAKLVTSVSRYTRRRFLSLIGIDPSRVRVLPNTVAPSFVPGIKSAALLDRYGLRGKRVLLTVGRLDPLERRKGHDKIIEVLPEVAKTNADVVYLVVGEGKDQTRLEALARQLGVEKMVLFAGRIEPDGLPELYRLADLFVMPSTQEGFGIVFLEAAASGVRAIGGNADGSIDALADGAVGTVIDPTNTAVLIQAIKDGLAGGGPDPAEVRRFAFANFASQVRELISRDLLCATESATA